MKIRIRVRVCVRLHCRSILIAAATATVFVASTTAAMAGSPVHASSVSEEADALFASGKDLMAKQRFAEACPMFEKSYALERADGTLLALGLCHEADTQRARAWRELSAVLVLANRSGRKDRQRVAQAALARIEPLVGRLVVRVADRKVGGAAAPAAAVDSVHRDTDVLGQNEIDVEVAVEPGHHVVTAVRDGHVVWQRDVDVDRGRVSEVIVPSLPPPASPIDLRDEPTPRKSEPIPAPAAPAAPAAVETSRIPMAALIFGGAGIVSLGAGAYFGLRSLSKWDAVEGRCDPRACRDASALDDASEAKSSALAANIFVGGGVALVAAGAAFWFFGGRAEAAAAGGAAPPRGSAPPPPRPVVVPLVANGGAGAIVTTRF